MLKALGMASLLRASVVLFLVLGLAGVNPAHAAPDAEKQIREHTKQAMEHFDMLEYELAKKLLLEAVVIAKKNRLTKTRVLAETYLYLGVVHFAGFEDVESARLAFMDAVIADGSAKLDDAYRTDEMLSLLDEVKAEAVEPVAGTDCSALQGVEHSLVDTANPGEKKSVQADVSAGLSAHKIVLHYRPDGAERYTDVKMELVGECTYKGAIPAKAVKGPILHYYIAAHDKAGRVLAGSGSRGSPHLIEVEVPPEELDDNPLVITKPVEPTKPARSKRVFIGLAVGSGGGYVSGTTESDIDADVGCCFAPAVFHVFPEIGVYFTPQLSVSAAARIGFPFDANREGHTTAAPSGLLRFRYALAPDGNGFNVNGAIGGGVIRHTVKLSMVPAGEGDVDTSASGPLIVGAGFGFTKPLGGPAHFVAEVSALLGIPIVEEFAGVEPNFAAQVDINLGMLFAF
jgi:hypothetical protein